MAEIPEAGHHAMIDQPLQLVTGGANCVECVVRRKSSAGRTSGRVTSREG